MENVYLMYQKVKAIEVSQLKNALLSKGGVVYWDDDDAPIVSISKFDTPCDAVITSAEITENDIIIFQAYDKECKDVTFTLFTGEIMYGHIDFITSSIE